jgi:D-lactate dehydrogenase
MNAQEQKPCVAFYSTKPYDIEAFNANNTADFNINYLDAHLTPKTVKLAEGHQAVCAFVNDTLDEKVLTGLNALGVQTIVMRCAGFNNVDVPKAAELGMRVLRVPAYSPYAVAEHALALIMTLNRKTYKAFNRVRDGNFLLDGLVGFDVHGKTVGVIGTGKIGEIFAGIMKGMGCTLLAYDPYPSEAVKAMGATYVSLDELLAQSDMISLHCPLMPATYHMIDDASVAKMKKGVMLINTSRGGLIETQAVVDGLKSGQIGALGLDVYEEEGDLFFEDLSCDVIQDDVFSRLLTFPNVLITGHQAFLTQEALHNIARTTIANLEDAFAGRDSKNEVK